MAFTSSAIPADAAVVALPAAPEKGFFRRVLDRLIAAREVEGRRAASRHRHIGRYRLPLEAYELFARD